MDLVTGVDLLDPKEQKHLWDYMHHCKPLVVIMGPPCTPFGGWGRFNRVNIPAGWQRSYETCAPIARLCGRIAEFQLAAGRHFVRENPYLTDMDYEQPWPRVLRHERVVEVVFDQCRVGLRGPHGKLHKKPTGLIASCPELVQDFRDLRCTGDHDHEPVQGPATKLAQIWPWKMAQMLVDGVVRLRRKLRRGVVNHALWYPTWDAQGTPHVPTYPH